MDYIESNANVMLGKPIVKGTRITVALILKKLSEGATAEALVEAYPDLTPASISAVLEYASDITSNERNTNCMILNRIGNRTIPFINF
jgi:uncharacterized protein (DUF433 family)